VFTAVRQRHQQKALMHVLRGAVTTASVAAHLSASADGDARRAALLGYRAAQPSVVSTVAVHAIQVAPCSPGASVGPSSVRVTQSGVASAVAAMIRSCPRRPAMARSQSWYGSAEAASHITAPS
jgi:hypothetical protein